MRLFLIAFTLSALSTLAFGQEPGRGSPSSGSQPMRPSRFESSSTQAYLVQQARDDREHRRSLLRYYDSIGFNYGAPEINGGVFFNAQPPIRYRRVFWTPPALVPYRYGL
jgi:hypothetical protein